MITSFPLIPRQRRLILLVTVVLGLGFLATSLVSYTVSTSALRDQIRSSGLPLTSDTIYSDIQNDLLPPILVSATMAQDTFLRDWVIDGEQDISRIIRYLREIRARNNTVTAFFVSEATRNYYHPTGIAEQVSSRDVTDAWYFRFRDREPVYEINADFDQANDLTLTIFINYKVLDYEGNFIGATGVGLTASGMLERIDTYEQRYGREIYFVDRHGRVVLEAGNNNDTPANIKQMGGLGAIAPQVLGAERGDWTYERGGEPYMLNSRYIEELGWLLLVEQPESTATAGVRRAFLLNLGIGLVIAILVVALTHVTIRHYQRQLEHIAMTDNLTGVANRRSFEMLAGAAARHRCDDAPPDSVILFDLDHLKRINDHYGHVTGDQVIRQAAGVARDALRATDVLCRWGGEEFAVWLRGCSLADARQLAETMRRAISGTKFSDHELTVTASFGVVAHQPGESLAQTLTRADQAMYAAKNRGRDRVQSAA